MDRLLLGHQVKSIRLHNEIISQPASQPEKSDNTPTNIGLSHTFRRKPGSLPRPGLGLGLAGICGAMRCGVRDLSIDMTQHDPPPRT